MRLRAVRGRGIRLARGVTVIDRDEVLAPGIHLAKHAQLLAWIDAVARRRRLVGVRAAHRARGSAGVSQDEAARLVGRGRARVGHDRVAYCWWQRERVRSEPPAIASTT